MSILVPKYSFGAALRLLSSAGPGALTISNLCADLHVTKGSFYHCFAGIPGFVDALLALRKNAVQRWLEELAMTDLDPQAQLEALLDAAVGLPHGTESAFRSWGRTSPLVAEAQSRIDADREDALLVCAQTLGLSPDDATLRARTAMAILAGVEQRESPVDGVELKEMMALVFAPQITVAAAELSAVALG